MTRLGSFCGRWSQHLVESSATNDSEGAFGFLFGDGHMKQHRGEKRP